MSLQNDVLAGFGLFARLHAVLHVNENVLTFEGGGVIDLDVLYTGIITNTIASTSISSASMIITKVETGSSCPFILFYATQRLNLLFYVY